MPEVGFEMIPSEPREPGWNRFLRLMPAMLKKPLPTEREMRILHRLVTSGVDLPPISDALLDDMRCLLVLRERDDLSDDQIRAEIGRVHFRMGSLLANTMYEALGLEVKPDTFEAREGLRRRGHLRSYGARSLVKDEPKKNIYAPHSKSYTDADGDEVYYLGLAPGLDEVFGRVCREYDRRMQLATTLDEKLEALIFFQMWSATVIHPFFDANGRGFGAQMVLALNRMGFEMNDVPALPEISDDLSKNVLNNTSNIFLRKFVLERAGIILPSYHEVKLMLLPENASVYKRYMDNLRRAVDAGIDASFGTEEVQPYIQTAMTFLYLWLSKNKYVDPEIYVKEAPKFIERLQKFDAAKAEGIRTHVVDDALEMAAMKRSINKG